MRDEVSERRAIVRTTLLRHWRARIHSRLTGRVLPSAGVPIVQMSP